MSNYNREYNKYLNRQHILPNFLEGAKFGVISQFLADLVLSILLFDQFIVIEDIRISGIASYYAAVASGAIASVLAIYMDPFAVVLFSTFTYSYVFQITRLNTTGERINIRPREILFDTGVAISLMFAFDKQAHHQYLRYQQKRMGLNPTYQRMDKSMGQTIFFIVLTNTYGFLKLVNPNGGENTNKS